MDSIVRDPKRAHESNNLIRMIDIPIVHGSAALVANATDVVSLSFSGIELSDTQAHPCVVRPLHSRD